MVMTFDNMRHRYADGEIPKGNLSRPAPVNWLKENAREDDAGPPGGTHVHIHPVEDACSAETEDRLANVEDAVARIVQDHYRFDEAGPAPLINQGGWNTKGHTLTGGSQSLPPNSTAASGPEYMPNAAGSIDEPTRQSFTPKQLDPGKTWGATADAMQRAEVYKHQMRQTNATINAIQAKNDAYYKRG
jgi:hypothetical protein